MQFDKDINSSKEFESPNIPIEDPRNMKVLHLREELKSRGLSPSGLKSTLVSRLIQALQQEGHNVEDFINDDYGYDFTDEDEPTYNLRWGKLPLTLPLNPEDYYTLIVNEEEAFAIGRKEIFTVQLSKG